MAVAADPATAAHVGIALTRVNGFSRTPGIYAVSNSTPRPVTG